jgi:hypothetical protein
VEVVHSLCFLKQKDLGACIVSGCTPSRKDGNGQLRSPPSGMVCSEIINPPVDAHTISSVWNIRFLQSNKIEFKSWEGRLKVGSSLKQARMKKAHMKKAHMKAVDVGRAFFIRPRHMTTFCFSPI